MARWATTRPGGLFTSEARRCGRAYRPLRAPTWPGEQKDLRAMAPAASQSPLAGRWQGRE